MILTPYTFSGQILTVELSFGGPNLFQKYCAGKCYKYFSVEQKKFRYKSTTLYR